MPRKVLVGVTASIAAYRSCDIISMLRKSGCEVKVAMTPDAGHFITPLTLQTLSGNIVYTDMFKLPEEWDVCHVSLGEWPDLILIAPASAEFMSKLARGGADCILSASVLSSKAPVLMAPAMNHNMYSHKATKSNITALKSYGYKFVGPKSGHLACGKQGMGHIADTADIVKAVKKALK